MCVATCVPVCSPLQGNPVKYMMKFLHLFVEVFDLPQCSNLLKDFEKARKKNLKV